MQGYYSTPDPGYYNDPAYNNPAYGDPNYNNPGYNAAPDNCNPPGYYDQSGRYQYYPGCYVNQR